MMNPFYRAAVFARPHWKVGVAVRPQAANSNPWVSLMYSSSKPSKLGLDWDYYLVHSTSLLMMMKGLQRGTGAGTGRDRTKSRNAS